MTFVPPEGPPLSDDGPEEPDLHQVGGTPPALLGVPSEDEISEDDWLAEHADDEDDDQ